MPQLGLVQKEVHGFLGVNLRKERLNLADEELAKAINADLHSQLGSIVVRLGRTKQFSTALTDRIIRRLARHNSRRYQVAGQVLYRNQVSILTGLHANLMTTIVPFRPLNDTTSWSFIADDAIMRKDNGTNVRIWGIAAATTKTNAVSSPSSDLTGDYSARYTYARKVGSSIAHESNPSPVSNAITLSTGALSVEAIVPTDAQITHIRYYRTVTAGAVHLFDSEFSIADTDYGVCFAWEKDEISGTVETQFTLDSASFASNGYTACFQWEIDHLDNNTPISTNNQAVITNASAGAYNVILGKADAALGTAVETDNNVPPEASWAASFQEHMFLSRDADNPHYLWFSKRFRPESIPTANFLEIGNPGDPVQCHVALAGMLAVFTRLTKYRVAGNAASGFVADEALSKRGTPGPGAVVGTEFGIIFPARDGIFVSNLISADQSISDDIFRLFIGEAVNGMDPINWDQAANMAAMVYKNRYYFAYPSGESATPDVLGVYSQDTKKWYFYDHPMRSLFVEEDLDDLVGGGADGFVYILEDGSTDAGTNITMDIETKDFGGQNNEQRKLFMYFRPDIDTLGDSITIELYSDGVLKRSLTVNSARTKPLVRWPEASMGYQWRARITYTGSKRARVYGVECLWLPLGEA